MSTKKWIDENGNEIPSSRVTKSEKLKERHLSAIMNKAEKLSTALLELKRDVAERTSEIYKAILEENGIDPTKHKGNITYFNFDRSIKIEVNQSERIVFDDTLISACRAKLMEFLDGSVQSNEEFVKQIILDAFETRTGGLDTKKVMGLLKYKKRVKNPLFAEAMNLLEDSISKPNRKTYTRIWKRNPDGEYDNVELNYSSVN